MRATHDEVNKKMDPYADLLPYEADGREVKEKFTEGFTSAAVRDAVLGSVDKERTVSQGLAPTRWHTAS
jgi:hypothetical protein